jgi:hypothetical protein
LRLAPPASSALWLPPPQRRRSQNGGGAQTIKRGLLHTFARSTAIERLTQLLDVEQLLRGAEAAPWH